MSRSVSAYRGWEKRRENEERVTVNLPPELLPLWRRVGRQFSGSPVERLEAFQEYVHENGDGEVVVALQDDADAKFEELLREHLRVA